MGDGIDNSIEGGTFHGTVVQARDVHYHPAAIATRAPRLLGAAPEVFVDRDPVFAALARAAAERSGRTAPLLVVVTGLPGMGKTATALRWLHQLGDDFPGGHLQADMSPQGPLRPRDPVAVLEGFVRELSDRQDGRPTEPDELAAHYRSLTAGAPTLVLLDNVVNAGQVRPLLPGHPGSVVVVTSRSALTGLRASHPRTLTVTLEALDAVAGADLFHAVAGRADVLDRPALEDVLSACAGLPLAVRIAGARAGELLDAGEDPAVLARELIDRRTRLEALAVPDDLSVPQVFDAAHASLPHGAAALYRALGQHPTPEFSRDLVRWTAGEAAGGDADTDADADVRTLVREGLLEPAGTGRLRMHRLVHDHARAAATSAEAEAATGRYVEWYLRRAAAVERLTSGRWRYGPLFASPQEDREAFGGADEALDAMEADRANVVAVAELAHGTHRYAQTWQLCEALRGFFFRRKYHADWIAVCVLGLEAAERGDDRLAVARMHLELAFAYTDARTGPAEEHYRHALRLASGATDAPGSSTDGSAHARTVSSALEGLGLLALGADDPGAAAEYFRRAVEALEDTDHPRGRALLTLHMGRARGAEHRHEEAAALLLRARELFAALQDRYNEAKSLWHYAHARVRADRPDQAVAPLDEAAALMRECGAPQDEAGILLLRGDVRAARGERAGAEADWRTAAELYERVGSPAATTARERLGSAGQDRTGPSDTL
ncbi:NB-ARC domain-containing protein [Streptomyces sp. NPDC053048]|uniref:NB-ARC domain-containing protein n=1 Tax=Streptomyces sp. NPDC053048 TaxID=3365694 RepID=UPI0037D3BBAD